LLGVGPFFSFLILYAVGRTPLKGDQQVASPLPAHRTTQTQKKTQTDIHVRFEPTTAISDRVKTVHAVEGAATMNGLKGMVRQ
jgi:hypothetical protein